MHYLIVAAIVITSIIIIGKYWKRPNPVNPQHPEKVFHEEECPICLDKQTYPVQASCGHEFCAECILGCLERNSCCPICRNKISILFRNFEDCHDELKNKLKRYNAFHDDRSYWQIITEAPLIIKRFFTHNDYQDARTTFTVIVLICIGIGYLLLPVDVLDEEKYGITGMIDDFGVVGGVLIYISIAIFKAVIREALSG